MNIQKNSSTPNVMDIQRLYFECDGHSINVYTPNVMGIQKMFILRMRWAFKNVYTPNAMGIQKNV